MITIPEAKELLKTNCSAKAVTVVKDNKETETVHTKQRFLMLQEQECNQIIELLESLEKTESIIVQVPEKALPEPSTKLPKNACKYCETEHDLDDNGLWNDKYDKWQCLYCHKWNERR